jgi:Ribosome inactivating protein
VSLDDRLHGLITGADSATLAAGASDQSIGVRAIPGDLLRRQQFMLVNWYENVEEEPQPASTPCIGFLLDLYDLYIVGVKVVVDGQHRVYALGDAANNMRPMQTYASLVRPPNHAAWTVSPDHPTDLGLRDPRYVVLENVANLKRTNMIFNLDTIVTSFSKLLELAGRGQDRLWVDRAERQAVAKAQLVAITIIAEAACFSKLEGLVVEHIQQSFSSPLRLDRFYADLVTNWGTMSGKVKDGKCVSFQNVTYCAVPGVDQQPLSELIQILKLF